MVRNGLVRYTSLPFLVMLCLFFLFAIGGAVTSATIYSTDNSSSTAIQDTISKMNNGDTLILDPGIYRENNITVSRDITIKGNASLQGSFANTIIDGMNEGRIFTLAGDCSFIIDNLSLENGRSPNGAPGDEVYAESGSVTIISSALSGYSSGRAVYARNGTETVINSFDLGQLSQNVMVPTTIPSPSLPASSLGYCMPGSWAWTDGKHFTTGVHPG